MINLYHNARCSKSRAAHALLEKSGHEFQTVFYLDTLPTADTLLKLLNKGDFGATALVRFGEAKAKDLGLKKSDALSDKQWCELLAKYPQLIERPIVETDTSAAIGRPIDNIHRLLDSL
ncbi:MAG: ArsC/Spx/MgsR family protein [Granulosicoccaceae bacterium]